jgi:hypothetical protein
MNNNKQKKSLGFLSVVAFLMVLVGVGYTVSSVFAVNAPKTSTSVSTTSPSEPVDTSPKESFFSSVEQQVAEKATALWNGMLGNVVGTSSGSQNVEENQILISETPSSAVAVLSLVPYPLPRVYTDIEQSKYQDAILNLYSNGLLQEGTTFHPTNYVRISDFIRVVMDAYRLKNHYDITSLEGLTEKMYFSFNMPREVLMRINSAYE